MRRHESYSTEIERERANTRRAIHARRLARLLPAFSKRHRIPLAQLEAVAVRSFSLCAICLGPMPTPRLYHVENYPIAFLCGRCFAAIDKTGGMLHLLHKHRRFNTGYRKNRGRLSRFIDLHSNLPDEVRFDVIEERERLALLAEDQPIGDPDVEDNVVSFPVEAARRLREQKVSDGEREPGHDPDE